MVRFLQSFTWLGVILLHSSLAFTQTLSNQYYSLTEYQGINPANMGELDAYFEKALIPALNRLAIDAVGVLQRTKTHEDGTTSIIVLVPLSNPSQLPQVIQELSKDQTFLSSASSYLDTDPKKPLYTRARSELLLAFDCFPKVTVPAQKKEGKDRLFEMRVYESPNEKLGHLKVEMFNNGEVPIFLDCGIQPVFMGQAIVGDKLPNLTYMTVYDNAEQRDECWKKFQKHPDWQILKEVKKYKDTVSKIHKTDLTPRPYSQL
jgi:hypothetical protein